MRAALQSKLLRLSFTIVSALFCTLSAAAQAPCLNDADLKRMLAQVESPQNVSLNKKLQEKLLKLREKDQNRLRDNILENRKGEDMLKRMRKSREKNTIELCPILKEFGWPTIALVGPDGAGSA